MICIEIGVLGLRKEEPAFPGCDGTLSDGKAGTELQALAGSTHTCQSHPRLALPWVSVLTYKAV